MDGVSRTAGRALCLALAAAAVTLFVAWWDAPSPCRRAVAAVALAVAAVLKVSPTFLAGLYLVRWWTAQEAEVRRESLQAGALFLVVALCRGGLSARPARPALPESR